MAKLKRTTKRTLIISLILVVVLVGAFSAFYVVSTKQTKAMYDEELRIAQDALADNTRQVYVTSRDIKYGEVLTAGDVTAVSEIVSIDASMFFTSADIGSVALVDIPAGNVITSDMITYEAYEDTLRETEFDVLVLNSNLTNGDFVDVRIRFQNGEDFVVLTKKCTKNISLRNAVCYMDLTEEETQLVSSAIVDASLYDAILYTTTYLEPSIQEASVVTYQPSADTQRIIFSNPNIVSVAAKELSVIAREEMEQRLAAYKDLLENFGSGQNNVSNIEDTPVIDGAGNTQGDFVGEDEYLDDTYTDSSESEEVSDVEY